MFEDRFMHIRSGRTKGGTVFSDMCLLSELGVSVALPEDNVEMNAYKHDSSKRSDQL